MSGICLRIECAMPEKLLERALKEGVVFRRVHRSGTVLTCNVDVRSAQRLSELCERYSISCRALSETGFAAFLSYIKRRRTLPVGLLTCAVCLTLALGRVWFVDITAVSDLPADLQSVRDCLAENDVRAGMSIGALDLDALEDTLSAASEEYSFVGARLQGVRLLIEVAAAVSPPPLYAADSAADLVAGCDGIVTRINVESGTACVRVGDTVTRGQALILGEERETKETLRGVAARGEVIARTWRESSASAPTRREVLLPTGRTSTTSELRLGPWSVCLTEGERFMCQREETEILPIGGLFLPLEVRRTTAREVESSTETVDLDALKRRLSVLAAAPLQSNASDQQWMDFTLDEQGVLTARAVCETHTDIAVSRDALYRQGG